MHLGLLKFFHLIFDFSKKKIPINAKFIYKYFIIQNRLYYTVVNVINKGTINKIDKGSYNTIIARVDLIKGRLSASRDI